RPGGVGGRRRHSSVNGRRGRRRNPRLRRRPQRLRAAPRERAADPQAPPPPPPPRPTAFHPQPKVITASAQGGDFPVLRAGATLGTLPDVSSPRRERRHACPSSSGSSCSSSWPGSSTPSCRGRDRGGGRSRDRDRRALRPRRRREGARAGGAAVGADAGDAVAGRVFVPLFIAKIETIDVIGGGGYGGGIIHAD